MPTHTINIIDDNAIDCLIKGLADEPIPGFMTEKTLAEHFAKMYAAEKNVSYELARNQRIYELTEVSKDISQIGTIRLMDEKDMPFFLIGLRHFMLPSSGMTKQKCLFHKKQSHIYTVCCKNSCMS